MQNYRIREFIVWFSLFSGILFLWIWGFSAIHFRERPDAYDYAQMGREIRQGHGFSTLQIFPRHIPFMHQRDYLNTMNWPNLYRYPLPTVSNAFFQLFVHDIIKASILQSGVWFLLGIPMLFFLAKRIANLTVAVISVIFYAADPILFQNSYNGMAESLATFLILSSFLVSFSGNPSKLKWGGMGVICGLGFLARTQLIILLPLTIFHIWSTVRKKTLLRTFALLLAGMLCTVSPWLGRNFLLTAKPLFSFNNTRGLVADTSPKHSDIDMQLYAPIDTPSVLKKYGSAILKKLHRNIWPTIITKQYWGVAFWGIPLLFLLFFSVALLSNHPINRQYKLFTWEIGLLILLNLLITTPSGFHVVHTTRFYASLRPLVVFLGICEFTRFLERLSFKYSQYTKWFAITMIVYFGIFQFSSGILRQKRTPITNEVELPVWKTLNQLTNRNSLVASDVSYKVVLHVECHSLRLPAYPEELLEIDKTFLPIDYVLLSNNVIHAKPSDSRSLWETYDNYAEFTKSAEFLNIFESFIEFPDGSILFQKKPEVKREMYSPSNSETEGNG